MSPHTPHQRPLAPLGSALVRALLAAALLCPAAHAANGWEPCSLAKGDTPYVQLETLRSIYKFSPDTIDRKSGTRSISNGTTTLTFGVDPRELSIQGVRCRLSHPAQTSARGELLLSRADVVTLIDPVLRPAYIPQRREVKTVVIDPGHGGHDVGQQTAHVREADSVLSLAHQLAAQLRQRGYEVILTREDNRYLSDPQRIDCANAAADAIFLSLHLNNGRSDYHGIETYTVAPFIPTPPPAEPAAENGGEGSGNTPAPPSATASSAGTPGLMPGNEQDAANIALAFALQASLVRSTGAQDGGCRRTRYSLLSSVRCPAAIVELGYATHAEEGAALSTEEYRSTLATALANGVDTFARAIKPGTRTPVTAAPPPPPPPTPVKVDKPAKPTTPKTDSSKSTRKAKNKPRRSSSKRTGRKR